ncbi:hypothetical protein F4811DRAFT_574325 [Daldinia bambusicola]|nr:hypothetical protein F4811DRAFT_574325 [Daldinia bambusicola]
MSKRTSTELERSAIVAVWLRLLEYYEGIVFLATNLVQNLDSAFMSRIHLAVKLELLNSERRTARWRNIVEFNQQVMDTRAWKPEIYTILGNFEVNGRVIKNLLRIAMFYARSKGHDQKLSPSHLVTTMKTELASHKNIENVIERIKELTILSQEHISENEAEKPL